MEPSSQPMKTFDFLASFDELERGSKPSPSVPSTLSTSTPSPASNSITPSLATSKTSAPPNTNSSNPLPSSITSLSAGSSNSIPPSPLPAPDRSQTHVSSGIPALISVKTEPGLVVPSHASSNAWTVVPSAVDSAALDKQIKKEPLAELQLAPSLHSSSSVPPKVSAKRPVIHMPDPSKEFPPAAPSFYSEDHGRVALRSGLVIVPNDPRPSTTLNVGNLEDFRFRVDSFHQGDENLTVQVVEPEPLPPPPPQPQPISDGASSLGISFNLASLHDFDPTQVSGAITSTERSGSKASAPSDASAKRSVRLGDSDLPIVHIAVESPKKTTQADLNDLDSVKITFRNDLARSAESETAVSSLPASAQPALAGKANANPVPFEKANKKIKPKSTGPLAQAASSSKPQPSLPAPPTISGSNTSEPSHSSLDTSNTISSSKLAVPVNNNAISSTSSTLSTSTSSSTSSISLKPGAKLPSDLPGPKPTSGLPTPSLPVTKDQSKLTDRSSSSKSTSTPPKVPMSKSSGNPSSRHEGINETSNQKDSSPDSTVPISPPIKHYVIRDGLRELVSTSTRPRPSKSPESRTSRASQPSPLTEKAAKTKEPAPNTDLENEKKETEELRRTKERVKQQLLAVQAALKAVDLELEELPQLSTASSTPAAPALPPRNSSKSTSNVASSSPQASTSTSILPALPQSTASSAPDSHHRSLNSALPSAQLSPQPLRPDDLFDTWRPPPYDPIPIVRSPSPPRSQSPPPPIRSRPESYERYVSPSNRPPTEPSRSQRYEVVQPRKDRSRGSNYGSSKRPPPEASRSHRDRSNRSRSPSPADPYRSVAQKRQRSESPSPNRFQSRESPRSRDSYGRESPQSNFEPPPKRARLDSPSTTEVSQGPLPSHPSQFAPIPTIPGVAASFWNATPPQYSHLQYPINPNPPLSDFVQFNDFVQFKSSLPQTPLDPKVSKKEDGVRPVGLASQLKIDLNPEQQQALLRAILLERKEKAAAASAAPEPSVSRDPRLSSTRKL